MPSDCRPHNRPRAATREIALLGPSVDRTGVLPAEQKEIKHSYVANLYSILFTKQDAFAGTGYRHSRPSR